MKKKEIKLSAEFKTNTVKTIFAISFFALTYFIILLLTLLFTCICIVLTIALIYSDLSGALLIILMGFCLAGLGVLIFIYLLKFIFKSHIEENLKQEINLLLSDNILISEITREIKDNLEKYTSRTWEYFDGANYCDDNLNVLYAAMHNYSFLLSRKYFLMKKALLTYQEELIKTTPVLV